jgi:hypothetical protein
MLTKLDWLGAELLACRDYREKAEALFEALRIIRKAKDELEGYSEYGQVAALVIEALNGNEDAQLQLIDRGLDKVIAQLIVRLGLPAPLASIVKEALELGNTVGTWISDRCLEIWCGGACWGCTEDTTSRREFPAFDVRSGREVSCLRTDPCTVYARCLVRTGGAGFIRGIIDLIRGVGHDWRWVKCH